MKVLPIDPEWAKKEFAAIFQVYGSALGRQIEAFNGAVGGREIPDEDIEFVFAPLSKEFKKIHRPLLNTLSLFKDPAWSAGGKAMIRLLDTYLGESLAAKDKISLFRDMLQNPMSYMDLLAELDWAARLRRVGGTIVPHPKTHPEDPDDNTNYDIHWEAGGDTFRGDVKWFKDWLVKPRGEDLLRGQIWLLRPDLKHHLVVKAPMRFWTPDDVIRTAEEVLLLYQAALDGRKDPRWVIGRNTGGKVQIAVRGIYDFPPPADLLVESVLILADGERGSISTVESGAGGFDDVEAALSNIRKAALQVPAAAGDGDICCLCIGSAVPQDADDVNAALFGRDDGMGGYGVFHPKSQEVGFEHLNAAVHFSLSFEEVKGDPNAVAVKRALTVFDGPKAMSERQRAFFRKVLDIYREDSVVKIA